MFFYMHSLLCSNTVMFVNKFRELCLPWYEEGDLLS